MCSLPGQLHFKSIKNNEEMDLFYFNLFHGQHSMFLCVDPNFCYCVLFALRASFNIYCSYYLLTMKSFRFGSVKKVFILLAFLKDIFSGYRILYVISLPLAFIVYFKKSVLILIFVPL